MVAISSSPCALNLICGRKDQQLIHTRFFKDAAFTMLNLPYLGRGINVNQIYAGRNKGHVYAKSDKSEESVPSWAKPDSDEPPPWARNEGKPNELKEGFEIPFFVYLLASAITAIAAIGSVFEYVNQKPVFGLLNSDSIFYAPLLGFFAITGIPTSNFLVHALLFQRRKDLKTAPFPTSDCCLAHCEPQLQRLPHECWHLFEQNNDSSVILIYPFFPKKNDDANFERVFSIFLGINPPPPLEMQ